MVRISRKIGLEQIVHKCWDWGFAPLSIERHYHKGSGFVVNVVKSVRARESAEVRIFALPGVMRTLKYMGLLGLIAMATKTQNSDTEQLNNNSSFDAYVHLWGSNGCIAIESNDSIGSYEINQIQRLGYSLKFTSTTKESTNCSLVFSPE